MGATVVPASTAVKRNRVGNVDSDRLSRRRLFLIDLLYMRSREIETRVEFAYRAVELHAVEAELLRRGDLAGGYVVTSPHQLDNLGQVC